MFSFTDVSKWYFKNMSYKLEGSATRESLEKVVIYQQDKELFKHVLWRDALILSIGRYLLDSLQHVSAKLHTNCLHLNEHLNALC